MPSTSTAPSPLGRRTVAVILVAMLALSAAACGSDPANSGGPVKVTLEEYTVDPSRDSTKAGSVTFDIANEGTMVHELVVFKTDLDPKALPLDEEGAVDEKGDGVEFIDERENIKPGDHVTLNVDLQPGSYVLLCNLEDHYGKGMVTTFTVTG